MKIPWLPLLFTLIILYLATTFLDVDVLVQTLGSADFMLIGYAMAVWCILVVFKSLKWQQMVASLDGRVSLFDSIQILFIGLFVSIVTPGRAGDFVRAVYVKNTLELGRGIMAVLVDRIVDIGTLIVFAGIGIVLLAHEGGVSFLRVETVILFIFVFVAGVLLALNRAFVKRTLWPLLRRFAPEKIRMIIQKYGGQFYDSLPLLRKNGVRVLVGVGFSTAAWLLSVTFGWYIMRALGLDLSWTVALAVIPVLALVEIIPAGFVGVGTREVAAVALLTGLGTTPEAAVAFSLVYFALGYIPSFILGAIFFLRHPISLRKTLKEMGFEWGAKG